MPGKHPNTRRVGGPGASHENRQEPEKSRKRGPHPVWRKSQHNSGVSGGGGEPDRRHSRDPELKSRS